jgi:hypothetical protein
MRVSTLLIPLAACLSLIGCSSVGDLKARKPEVTLSSTKPAKVVAGCVSDGYLRTYTHYVMEVSSRITSTGYAVQQEARVGMWGKTVGSITEINETPNNGSQAELYFAFDAPDSNKEKVRSLVQSCL